MKVQHACQRVEHQVAESPTCERGLKENDRMLARHVQQSLVQVKLAQYYRIMFDSMPDMSHCYKMSHVMRCKDQQQKGGS